MWGSDFPVVASREGYANALLGSEQAFAAADRDRIFGATARLVFGSREWG